MLSITQTGQKFMPVGKTLAIRATIHQDFISLFQLLHFHIVNLRLANEKPAEADL
jgi:hypothetical protein